MNYNVIPLFRSQYSLIRSILTLNEPNGLKENYPISIIDIAKHHNLPEICLIDNSMSGFLEAYQNCEKQKIKFVFGLLVNCIEDIDDKSENSLKTLSKVIIFAKNYNGYKDLIKISSLASTKGFYYKPNIDWKNLNNLWSDNLKLYIPFYDGFIFANRIDGNNCIPNIPFTKPTFFIENSGLPFDSIIQKRTKEYAEINKCDIIKSRSIYYYKKDDFLSYITFRCIGERSTLEKPNLNQMSSDWFSFEKWEEQNNNPQSIYL